jgi:hypothetical protein
MDPLIIPQDIIDYTENSKVSLRQTTKLEFDIVQAESELERIFIENNKDFQIIKDMNPFPSKAKLALIMLAEYFALRAISQKNAGVSSETLDDYTYQKAEISMPDVTGLVKEFLKIENTPNPVSFKMRLL